ncbi:MAG: insulinase family protein, partial [Rickettsiales bacterium]|nr:insulinase family protein [Rickettsiales bacterium]
MRKIRANISRSKLKNGLSVATDRMPGLPVDEVFLRLLVAGGSCIESKSDSGYSHLLEHIILNGSKNFPDSRATVESAYGYIAGFTSQFDTGYDISIPKKHMELGIRILADMVQNPTVSEEQLEKEKSIIEMEQIQYPFKAHPLDIASFGEDCPLCRPIMGSRENVANATRGSLLKFMDENYSANKIALLAVGDVNHDRICETAARCFAGIKPYTPYRHSGLKFNEQSIHGINDNGALGITASFRFLNEYDTTPERYVATRIGANSIYGKITDVIREKHAMIY